MFFYIKTDAGGDMHRMVWMRALMKAGLLFSRGHGLITMSYPTALVSIEFFLRAGIVDNLTNNGHIDSYRNAYDVQCLGLHLRSDVMYLFKQPVNAIR